MVGASSTGDSLQSVDQSPSSIETAAAAASPTVSQIAVADQIFADMQGLNEAHPQGVPLSWAWAKGPAITMGNNPDGDKAITSWGVLYVAASGNPATNTRVNIRDMQTLVLQRSTLRWLLAQSTSDPNGAAYLDDFAGNSNKPTDIRHESDGTISATAGDGYNFHFYPYSRGQINPNDVAGIVVVVQARLILGDPTGLDDRSSARYLLGSGADYYPNLTGSWYGNTSYNPGVGNGKMKIVKIDWRSLTMTTCTKAQLESNPPPVDLSGILP